MSSRTSSPLYERRRKSLAMLAAFSLVLSMLAQVGFSTALPHADAAQDASQVEEPAAEEPAAEEPAAEEPAAEDPAAEDPAAEDPAAEDPAAEDPAAEDPAAEDPAAEDPAAEDPAAEEAVAPEPLLTIVKDADLAMVNLDETITYTITVENTGNVDLTGVVVADEFADGATFADGDTNDNKILEPTEIWTYTADYTVTQADIDAAADPEAGIDLVNVATVDTDQTDAQQDDAVTTINPDAYGPFVTYLVKFAPGAASQGRNDALKAAGGKSVGSIAALGIELVDFPAASADNKSQALEKNPNIVYVAKNFTRAIAGTSNDTEYADQWSLPQIGWDLAYEVVYPAGSATIAVLDTGIDATHVDLAANVVTGTSFIEGSDPTTDPNGHGTALAGIAGAKTGNGIGIAAVGYSGVRIMPVTVLAADGTGTDANIIAGVVWAADNGADVILMGFSNPGFSQALQDAADYAWTKGAVLVAATGNGGSATPTYPAGMSAVMGVSATTQNDNLAAFSNYGDTVFLGAPGVSIDTLTAGGGYGTITGTSVSAAEVAGVAALIMANDSSATNGQVVYRLGANAVDAGTVAQTGNGRLNLNNALVDTSTESTKPAIIPGGGPVEEPYVASAGGNLDQCANGSLTRFLADQTDVDQCAGTAWVNGNLGASKSHYVEGDSVPYRDELSGLDAGAQYTFEIQWDVTKGGKHALDYITSFDRTEADADPCSDKGFGTGCESSPDSTFAIPADTTMTSQADWAGAQESGVISLWGGTVDSMSAYISQVDGGTGEYVADSSTNVQITFTVDGTNAVCADDNSTPSDQSDDLDCSLVFAWGGHIASRADWGQDNAAVNISGSPFHMRQKALYDTITWVDADSDGFIDSGEADAISGIGNQDRSLSNAAVVFPGTITVVKDSQPEDAKDFEFSVDDGAGGAVLDSSGDPVNDFFLDDDADDALSNTEVLSLLPGTYRTTELAADDWTLQSISCDTPTIPDPPSEGSVTVTIGEAEDVTCTFVNTLDFVPAPSLTVAKDVDLASISAPGTLTYTITVTNTGNVDITNVVLTDDLAGVATLDSGDLNTNSILETDEVWVYSATYAATQADINAGDDLVNTASVVTTEVPGPTEDDATTTITQTPAVSIDKEGTLDMTVVAPPDRADVGDEINYAFDVSNDGNVTLSNVVVSDPLGVGLTVSCGLTSNSDAFANDGTDTLYPGETVQCFATYTLTQPDIDAGRVDNIGFVDSTDPNDDPVEDEDPNTEVVPQDPLIDIDKAINRFGEIVDVATLPPSGGYVEYVITVTNDGNVTLSNVTVTDPDVSECDYTVGTMAPGDTDTYNCTAFIVPPLINTATATGTPPIGDDVSDEDTATVTLKEGPGVGTPGFWKNWPEVWDGNPSNDGTFSGRDWFPEADILYPVVDPVIGTETLGILIGDWNFNGVCDPWEDCIFYTLEEAHDILNGEIEPETGELQDRDKRQTLARQLVASWLNVMAGNDFGCIEDAINDGVAWLIANSPDENGDSSGDGNLKEDWKDYRVKPGINKDPDGDGKKNPRSEWLKSAWSGDAASVAGEAIYDALTDYNETGGGCAIDRDTGTGY